MISSVRNGLRWGRHKLRALREFLQPLPSLRGQKFSGYLSIYNDWEILAEVLKSVAPFLDELVVVDGAYDWMAAYVVGVGGNPVRSDDRVYQILDESGIPYRTIQKTWANEVDKRRAGYEACSHRYIFRIDADEVSFFSKRRLREFLKSGAAAADMEMPLYVAPGWIVARTDMEGLPGQGFLFDSAVVDSSLPTFTICGWS